MQMDLLRINFGNSVTSNMLPTMDREEVEHHLKDVRNLVEDVEDIHRDVISVRGELRTTVMTLRKKAQVIQTDLASLNARAGIAWKDLYRRNDDRDLRDKQTQSSLESMQCAMLDLQSQVTTLDDQDLLQTQARPIPRRSTEVEPGADRRILYC